MTTITYDSTPADQPEFSEEELDSIQVGEQLQAEQQQMLAGKYESAEELEQAYLELQSRFSSGERETQEPEEVEEEYEPQDFVSRLIEGSRSEYTEDLLNELDNTDPRDLAQMFLDYQEDAPQSQQQISQDDVEGLYNSVGGKDSYQQMLGWAAETLSEEQISMFDDVVGKGDPLSAFFAIQYLNSQYRDAVGVDGEMLTGKPAISRSSGFRSQAEMVAAMNDPRYDEDPAYRADVYAKIDQSNF